MIYPTASGRSIKIRIYFSSPPRGEVPSCYPSAGKPAGYTPLSQYAALFPIYQDSTYKF